MGAQGPPYRTDIPVIGRAEAGVPGTRLHSALQVLQVLKDTTRELVAHGSPADTAWGPTPYVRLSSHPAHGVAKNRAPAGIEHSNNK